MRAPLLGAVLLVGCRTTPETTPAPPPPDASAVVESRATTPLWQVVSALDVDHLVRTDAGFRAVDRTRCELQEYDLTTGAIRERASLPKDATLGCHCHAIVGGAVCRHAEERWTVHALDGHELFSTPLGTFDYASVGDLAIVANETGLNAVDARTGAPRWHHRLPSGKLHILHVDAHGVNVYVGETHRILAFDPSGKKRWEQPAENGANAIDATRIAALGPSARVLDAKTGDVLLECPNPDHAYAMFGAGDYLALVSAESPGALKHSLRGIDAKGTTRWRLEQKTSFFVEAVWEGHLFDSGLGGGRSIELDTGNIAWREPARFGVVPATHVGLRLVGQTVQAIDLTSWSP